MYPLLGALALASTLALGRAADTGGFGRWALYAGLSTSMVYTHYLGFWVLLAHGLWIAGHRRAHLLPWVASMAAAAALYAPWTPSMWFQITDAHGWAWFRANVTIARLGDLFGLFAFGGSLFGMGSYFFGGSLGVPEQLLLLLPFLVALWWGVRAMASDRGLALVGLPPAVTIGMMFAISLVKPMFYPRWFSFLVPFYAIVLAQGILVLADRFRGRRAQAVALLTAGVMLYSLPVLGRYYLDGQFRPYRWRDAAAYINRRVEPGDYFLYENMAARVALSYYLREPHLSLTLKPIEAVPLPDRRPTFTDAAATRLARQHRRVWFIATAPFTPAMQKRLLPVLGHAFRTVTASDFDFVWVALMEARAPGQH